MSQQRIVITLGIWGFTDIPHQEITDTLQLQPIKVHVIGERINPNFFPVAKKNGWMYSIPDRELQTFDVQMNEIVELLTLKRVELSRLTKRYYAELSCAVFCEEEQGRPWIHLTKEHVSLLHALNLEFDVDLYT